MPLAAQPRASSGITNLVFRAVLGWTLMLAWYRDRARAVAGALLMTLASLAAATGTRHHDDCHDAVCLTAVVPHDAASHSFEGPPVPDDHPLHCVICHWIRGFKPAAHAIHAGAPSIPDAALVHAPFVGTPASFPAAQPPLRSPPVPPARA
jgi:hypothetical protein